jgi:DNA primase
MSQAGDGALEDFKSRLPLVDIVARHVRLIRRGNRHQGLCPFHQEKSPSFYVFEDQGNYHCFGCGAHGNAIDFVMAIEGLPFAEALRRLSDLTGIPAPLRSPSQAETSAERVNPLLAANEAARGWFQEQLAASAGRIARDYLQRRGVPEALRQRFAIGYAPDGRDVMVRALEARGVAVATQVQAGLAIDPEDGGRPFDRFRHRLMFPITDQRGRLVGFGGRALGDAKAKYLNTPETPLFKKGSLLYGHDLASKPAREKKEIFIVEGYLDVIAMHEAGFANTVAPLGTAIGEDQLKLLWRYGEEPYVCLDGDAAGLAAALRMIRRALPIMAGGQTLRFVVLPAGEDPDSLLHGRGRTAFEDLLASAVPLSQMIWQAEHNAAPVATPEQLAGLRRRLLDYVRLTGDAGLRDGLKRHFDDLVYARGRGLGRRRSGGGQASGGGRHAGRSRAPQSWQGNGWQESSSQGAGRAELKASMQQTERYPFLLLLGAFLRDPTLLERHADDLDSLVLDGASDAARREVLNWLAAEAHLDATSLDNHLSRYGFAGVAKAARETFAGLAATSRDDAGAFGLELEEMLARRRARIAAEIEREAVAEALRKGRFDVLAGQRLDRLLNGGGGDDGG